MRARRSPRRARDEPPRSTPVAIATPSRATAIPDQAVRVIRSPPARARSAAHTGWVETSATDEATVVSERLAIHAAKWAPRTTPAPTATAQTRGPGRARDRPVTAEIG